MTHTLRHLAGLRLYREDGRWTLTRPGLRLDAYRTPWGGLAVCGQWRNLVFGGECALLSPNDAEFDGPKGGPLP